MAFENSSFIKPAEQFDPARLDYAPMFRKKFTVDTAVQFAVLTVCGLGYGYYYLNGSEMTPDLFTAPVSNYEKTLWYNRYDVTEQIKTGENILAVICGNGWYNEGIRTAWDYDAAPWRDIPKFILTLEINGEVAVRSDASWRYTLKSPYLYNQLRVGEHFDARLYDENWNRLDFDDSAWGYAKEDDHPPKGIFRECLCQPIRVCGEYPPKSVKKIGEDRYLFDFGLNMSGVARLKVHQSAGDRIVLEYAESMNPDNTIQYNDMDNPHYYPDSPFQTDEFICGGGEMTWTPKFTYHGFRYVVVTGLKEATAETLTALFIHQDVNRISDFECSDENLNSLFRIGIQATWSNLFYMPTDCPTREKLGWMNDAQSSTEQMLTDFDMEKLLTKWWQDICDAMREDGMLPGIVPSSGWGYEWGNGPVSEGTLFEIPYRIYLHTGDDTLLKKGLTYFKKYNRYLQGCKDAKGDICYGLDDWAPPDNTDKVGAAFINKVFTIKFLRITILAQRVSGEDPAETQALLDREIQEIQNRYLDETGRCTIHKQTAVAMLVYNGLYENLAPLSEQLKELVEEKNFHHDCGMVGLRRLYMALNRCGLQEYAYRIITARGFPSYVSWLEDGATALYEFWDMSVSQNHHMYSDFMSWMMKTILGIGADIAHPGFTQVEINPYFFRELTYARGYCGTVRGRIGVAWKRTSDRIELTVEVPEGMTVTCRGQTLKSGVNVITA